MLLVLESILQSQHPTPRMAEQIEVFQSQSFPYLLHLLAIAVDRPESGVGWLVGIEIAELGVLIKLDIGLGEKAFEALEATLEFRPQIAFDDLFLIFNFF